MYIYYKDTGEIFLVSNQLNSALTLSFIQVEDNVDTNKYYVEKGELALRPLLYPTETAILTLNSSLYIENIPEDSLVFFEDFDNPYTIKGGFVEIEFVDVGEWDLLLFPKFPYATQKVKVIVQ